MNEGRKEGRKEGRQAGRKEGWKKGILFNCPSIWLRKLIVDAQIIKMKINV